MDTKVSIENLSMEERPVELKTGCRRKTETRLEIVQSLVCNGSQRRSGRLSRSTS